MTSTRSTLCSNLGGSYVGRFEWLSWRLCNLEHWWSSSDAPSVSSELSAVYSMRTRMRASAHIHKCTRSRCLPANLLPTRKQESMVAGRKTSLLSHPQSTAAPAFGACTAAYLSVVCDGRSQSNLRTGLFGVVRSQVRRQAEYVHTQNPTKGHLFGVSRTEPGLDAND
eukprot:COSAG02_NODE_2365_length_9052_cov_11.510779_5_plen_168_part_00